MDRSPPTPDEPLAEPSLQAIRHELRTPVNHIIGFSEMLLEEAADLEGLGPQGEAKPLRFAPLREVVAAGRAMLALVDEWLAQADPLRPAAGLPALAARLAPYVASVGRTCQALAERAEADGAIGPATDLLKIAAAAAHLGDLAAGAVLPTALPLAPSDAADEGERGPEGSHTGRLLIVDDSPLNRDLLARRLERLGYTTAEAADGQEALVRLRAEPFDLLLLDLMMPELDGYDVLRARRADPALERIPVIVLSALDDTAHVVRAVELGADDYLPKPFDPVLLRARIGACLAKKRLRDMEAGYLQRLEEERRRGDDLLNVVIPLGVALSSEKDFNLLLERFVVEAQRLSGADGGTLYLIAEEKLRFMIVRTSSLQIAMGGASGKDIPFPPLRLYDEQSGAPLFNYVVTHAALEGKTINIADAYHADGYDFSGTRDFDARTGYHTTSVLTVPLKDGAGRVIGVLQLINAKDGDGRVVPFDDGARQMLESLGSLAAAALAAALREQQLRQEITDLRIEIDQQKKQHDLEQITSSPYFASLQSRARQLRDPAARRENGAEPAGPTRHVFQVGDQEIVAREQGPARGRLLLLIHGWSSSWYALSPLLSTLSDRYRCVAVDLPGFGESPPLKERASIAAYADLLAELIRQLSPGLPAVLVGHSMGGMTSVTLALRHPELVERMALLCPTISGRLSTWINTAIYPITWLERSRVAGGIVARLEPYMLRVTDRLMRPASFAERTDISEADYHRLRADARRPGQGRVRAECFWAMRENDLQGRLGGIAHPTMVIWGMEDNTVPLRDASAIADEWPGAQLQVLPKAGHWPQFETPEITRRHIRSFLSTPIKLLRTQKAEARREK
jgi:pimeloyl-ACP methyl ester carboxylesterase/DNA-binding response OmpR family regulator/GAF domain-containing protein